MGALLFILFVVLVLALVSNFESSKKESTRERIGDAVSRTAYDAADTISDITNSLSLLAEPDEKKRIRLAKKTLSDKNWLFSHCEFHHSEELKSMLEVSDGFRDALSVLGLDVDEWKVFATDTFYYHKILHYSFLNDNTYSKETDKNTRASIINNESISGINWGVIHDDLEKALLHFGINPKEWIEYGYAVLAMYRICDDEFHKKFIVH